MALARCKVHVAMARSTMQGALVQCTMHSALVRCSIYIALASRPKGAHHPQVVYRLREASCEGGVAAGVDPARASIVRAGSGSGAGGGGTSGSGLN